MQMKQDELNALRKLEAESTQLENEAAELTSNTVAAKRGFIEKCVFLIFHFLPHADSEINCSI
jgi:hypothetical protein